MNWIFLSPHFDDAVLSCGGLIWELTHAGDTVGLLTVCAGVPPAGPLSSFAVELHIRWQTSGAESVFVRQQEDDLACMLLNASPLRLDIPDCIYRRIPETGQPLIHARADLFRNTQEIEADLLEGLISRLAASIPGDTQVVSPLALGKHVDHNLVRTAAERLIRLGLPVKFYADYPYVMRKGIHPPGGPEWQSEKYRISPIGLEFWKQSAGAYRSQVSSFWKSFRGLSVAIAHYAKQNDGILLYNRQAE
jgi:LmbE family N-acetylglucosaminyl deacetylase